jgi:hypothetical protein
MNGWYGDSRGSTIRFNGKDYSRETQFFSYVPIGGLFSFHWGGGSKGGYKVYVKDGKYDYHSFKGRRISYSLRNRRDDIRVFYYRDFSFYDD